MVSICVDRCLESLLKFFLVVFFVATVITLPFQGLLEVIIFVYLGQVCLIYLSGAQGTQLGICLLEASQVRQCLGEGYLRQGVTLLYQHDSSVHLSMCQSLATVIVTLHNLLVVLQGKVDRLFLVFICCTTLLVVIVPLVSTLTSVLILELLVVVVYLFA